MTKVPLDRVVFTLFNELIRVYVLRESHSVRSGKFVWSDTEIAILFVLYIAHLSFLTREQGMAEVIETKTYTRFAVFVLTLSHAVRGYTLRYCWGIHMRARIYL